MHREGCVGSSQRAIHRAFDVSTWLSVDLPELALDVAQLYSCSRVGEEEADELEVE